MFYLYGFYQRAGGQRGYDSKIQPYVSFKLPRRCHKAFSVGYRSLVFHKVDTPLFKGVASPDVGVLVKFDYYNEGG